MGNVESTEEQQPTETVGPTEAVVNPPKEKIETEEEREERLKREEDLKKVAIQQKLDVISDDIDKFKQKAELLAKQCTKFLEDNVSLKDDFDANLRATKRKECQDLKYKCLHKNEMLLKELFKLDEIVDPDFRTQRKAHVQSIQHIMNELDQLSHQLGTFLDNHPAIPLPLNEETKDQNNDTKANNSTEDQESSTMASKI